MEIRHQPALFAQQSSIGIAEDDAPASGENEVALSAQDVGEGDRFAVAKCIFAMGGEEGGDGLAQSGFKIAISIDEGPPEPASQQRPDGTLAACAVADEGDPLRHGWDGRRRSRRSSREPH